MFRRDADPLDLQDLSSAEPERRKRMLRALEMRIKEFERRHDERGSSSAPTVLLKDDLARKLEELGYVELLKPSEDEQDSRDR